MRKSLKLSVVTAGLITLGTFAGCSSDGSAGGDLASVFGIKAADGYIVKLISPAKVTCGTNVYYTDANVTTPQGDMKFNGIAAPLASTCKIETPANAIMDSDGDNVYTAADENNSVGFIMRADGDDAVVSHLTTMVEDLRAQGKSTEATALKALVKDYDPVKAIDDAATTGTADQNASSAKAQQLLTLGEAIKTMKKAGATAADVSAINVTAMITDIENNVTAPKVATMLVAVPATFKAAAEAKANAQSDLLSVLPSIKESGLDVDLTQYVVSVSDGGQTATTAIKAATTGTFDETRVADLNLTALDTDINKANTDLTTAITNAPALVSLGNTLKIGSVTAAITDGTFNVEVPVKADSNLSNYSKIEMLGSTISKGFDPQTGVSLEIKIVNKVDTNDVVTMMINGITLAPNETNTTVKTTIADNALVSVKEDINGVSNTKYTNVSGAITNTDFSFDIATIVGKDNNVTSYIESFNKYFQNAGKVYDVTLSLMGVDAEVLTSDYLQDDNTTHAITGKVTTTGTVTTPIGSTTPTPPTTPTLTELSISLASPSVTVNKDATENVSITAAGNDVTTRVGTNHNTSIATASISGSTLIVTGVAKGETTISVIAEDNTTATKTAELIVTVPNTAPTAPTNLMLPTSAETEATVNVSWTAATDADGDTITYDVRVMDENNATVGTPSTGITGTSTTITAPSTAGTYKIEVGAKDDAGLESATGVISNLTVTAATTAKDITGWLETANGVNGVTIFGTSTSTGTVYVEKAFVTNIGTLASKCISFTKGTEAGSLITAANGQTSEICVYPNKAYAAEAISIAVKWDDNSVSFVDLKAGDLD